MKCVLSYEKADGTKNVLLTVNLTNGQVFEFGDLTLVEAEDNPLRNIGLVLRPPVGSLANILTRPGQKLVFEVSRDPVEVPQPESKQH